MVSGYYYNEEKKSYRIKKAIKLACGCIALYTLLNCALAIFSGRNMFYWIVEWFDLRNVVNLVIFNRAAFISSITYYLLMMVYVYAITFFIKEDKYNEIFKLIIPFLVIAIFMLKLDIHWYYVGNWLFIGVPFFFMGIYCRLKMKNNRNTNYSIVMCLGVCITLIETYMFGQKYLMFGTIVLVYGIFMFCLSNPGNENIFSTIGRKYSMYIFLFHCVIGRLFSHIIENTLVLYIAITVVSVICSIIFSKLVKFYIQTKKYKNE